MTPERWLQVERIYREAEAQPPGERASFLDQACVGDTDLRGEVERMLAGDSEAAGFLEAPAMEVAARALAQNQARPEEPLTGQMMSHYRILEKLGEGGMGAVYRAFDTQLRRPVALKVLPPEYASDPQRRSRLLREARAASALNHPNIVGIHEVGSDNGVDFIAMEFVEGKCLSEVIPAKGLPVGKALDYAGQIANGLAKAHAAGVVHRDLKPGNIMLTADGLVKLLDFGLARSTKPVEGQDTTLTAEGEIVGTPSYMSPEQVRGERVDHRSDIFSFGCVLYEMLTGQRAFRGATSVEVMNAILTEEPPELPPVNSGVPLRLERTVRHCLEKNPEERFQSAGDLAFDLEALPQVPTHTVVRAQPIARWKRVVLGSSILAALVLGAALTTLRMWRPEPALKASERLAITLPGDAPLAPGGLMPLAHDRPVLALSPDGARLAYVAQVGGNTQIYTRDMTTGKVAPLPGTEGGFTPFFSPDGASIGFFAEGKLKKIPSGGGAVLVLTDAPQPYGGVWGTDGVIYFNRQGNDGIHKIQAEGGAVEVVTTGLYRMPELLGPGRGLLASFLSGIVYVDRKQTSRFLVNGFGARYVPTGHLVYSVQGRLAAVPFDRSRVEVTGPSVSLFEDLRTAPYGVAQFTFAQGGTLVYAPGRPQGMASFVWVDRKGKTRSLGLPERCYSTFDLSPDGKRLAFGVEVQEGAETEIWIYDLSRGTTSRLTPRLSVGRPALNLFPRWTPDGRHVVYLRNQETKWQFLWQPADGNAEAVELRPSRPAGLAFPYPMSFSPDGSVMTLFGASPNKSFDLYLMRVEGIDRPVAKDLELFLGTPYAEAFGQISPNGRWMLYASDQSGRWEIYVTSYPKPGATYQISRSGGHKPLWNPNAPEILYRFGTKVYAVDVSFGSEFRAGEPRLLFEGPYPNVPGFDFDITPDGQQFLMLENKDFLTPSTTLTVITNFFDELRRRVPSRSGKK